MILNASIMRIRISVEVTGMSCGQEILQKSCHRLAPSTIAASINSAGRLSRAASKTMNMKGVHCQMSPSITTSRAPHA